MNGLPLPESIGNITCLIKASTPFSVTLPGSQKTYERERERERERPLSKELTCFTTSVPAFLASC